MGVLERVDEIIRKMDCPIITEMPQKAQDLYYYFEMNMFRVWTVKQQMKDLGMSSATYYKYRKLLEEKDLVLVIKRRNAKGLFDKNLYARGSKWHIQAGT